MQTRKPASVRDGGLQKSAWHRGSRGREPRGRLAPGTSGAPGERARGRQGWRPVLPAGRGPAPLPGVQQVERQSPSLAGAQGRRSRPPLAAASGHAPGGVCAQPSPGLLPALRCSAIGAPPSAGPRAPMSRGLLRRIRTRSPARGTRLSWSPRPAPQPHLPSPHGLPPWRDPCCLQPSAQGRPLLK